MTDAPAAFLFSGQSVHATAPRQAQAFFCSKGLPPQKIACASFDAQLVLIHKFTVVRPPHSHSFVFLETMVVTVLLIVLVALAVAAAGAAEEVPVACHPTWEKTGIPREHTDEGSCY